ncbi:hypothetical protein GCM10027186_44610 [Micromonospora schwarzwaldensis]
MDVIQLPAVRVVVTDAPPGRPVIAWLDTGSGPGLELVVPPEQRWRITRRGDDDVLLLMPKPEDVEALRIFSNAHQLWNAYDPEEQDPL